MVTIPGRFITLEGGEGAGKSTQIRALAAMLSGMGVETVTTREPGGSAGAEHIRSMILSNDESWDARSEALLFAAARADHVRALVLPALARGAWVLCDRYIDSSRAYQGVGHGLGDDYVMTLHRLGANLMPDRTIVLDVGQEEGQRRVVRRDGATTDRIGGRNANYHRNVIAAFRRYAAEEPGRMRLVDAGSDPDTVTARIIAEVRDLLPTTT